MTTPFIVARIDPARLAAAPVLRVEPDGVPATSTMTVPRSHIDINSVVEGLSLAAFVQSNTGVTACTFSAATRRYTIQLVTAAVSAWAVEFRSSVVGAGGPLMAQALGIDSSHALATDIVSRWDFRLSTSSSTAAADIQSNVAPYYLIELDRDGVSDYSREFEERDLVKRAITNHGRSIGVAPRSISKLERFRLRFMPLSKVFKDEATVAHPWTLQHFIEHVRVWEPWLLHLTHRKTVYKMTERSGTFDDDLRDSVWGDYQELWDVDIEAQLLGRLA